MTRVEYKILIPKFCCDDWGDAIRWWEDALHGRFGGFHKAEVEGVWGGHRMPEKVVAYYVAIPNDFSSCGDLQVLIKCAVEKFNQQEIYYSYGPLADTVATRRVA